MDDENYGEDDYYQSRNHWKIAFWIILLLFLGAGVYAWDQHTQLATLTASQTSSPTTFKVKPLTSLQTPSSPSTNSWSCISSIDLGLDGDFNLLCPSSSISSTSELSCNGSLETSTISQYDSYAPLSMECSVD